MTPSGRPWPIGVWGCGTIGSGVARTAARELKTGIRIAGVFDKDPARAARLAADLGDPRLKKSSLKSLVSGCRLVVEAVHDRRTASYLHEILSARRDVLVMSVGCLLGARRLHKAARDHGRTILVPSGAVGGIDAVKAFALAGIDRILLVTRKPPESFAGHPLWKERGIDPLNLRGEQVLFDGDVRRAVRLFPQNINVAATLALAGRCERRLRVRIVTSPEFRGNSHEVIVEGRAGSLRMMIRNVPCPDNPKTSYMAVLSAVEALRRHVEGMKIGS